MSIILLLAAEEPGLDQFTCTIHFDIIFKHQYHVLNFGVTIDNVLLNFTDDDSLGVVVLVVTCKDITLG